MNLLIKGFPDELAKKLRIEAAETEVTLREALIRLVVGHFGGGNGFREVKRAELPEGVRGVRGRISKRRRGERVAEIRGAHSGASGDAGAMDGGVSADRGEKAEKQGLVRFSREEFERLSEREQVRAVKEGREPGEDAEKAEGDLEF